MSDEVTSEGIEVSEYGLPIDNRSMSHSPQIDASRNSGHQWFNLSISKEGREKLMTFALIASTLMMLWCWYTIDQYKAEVRLKEYDLDAFKSEQFAKLNARVEADEKLIQSLLDRSK